MRAFAPPSAKLTHRLFARVLLCFLVAFLQSYGLAVHGQELPGQGEVHGPEQLGGYKEYLDLLNNPNADNHAYAIANITKIPMSPEEELTVVGPLVKATRDRYRSNRRNANYSLMVLRGNVAKHGVSVVPALIKLFQHDEFDVRDWAAQVLIEIGESAIPDLEKALEHRTDGRVRVFAMHVLGMNGKKAERAIPKLLVIMQKKPLYYEQVDAAIAITRITNDPSTISVLLQGLQQEDPDRVSRSADALAQYGPIVRVHYPLLKRVLLENKSPRARGSAARALVKIEAPKDVWNSLISALNKERQFYLDTLKRLSRLSPRQQEDELYKTAQAAAASDESRGSIFDALMTFRVPIKMWRQQLIDLLLDQSEKLRTGDGDNDVISTLKYRLDFERLPGLGSSAVKDLLVILNEESNDHVRRFVLNTLGAIGLDAKEAVPDLLAAMKDPKHEDIRDAVVETLGLVGPTAPDKVLPVLTEAVESYTVGLRVHTGAATAIKKIAKDLQDRKATEYIALLESAHQRMNPNDVSIKEDRADVARAIDHLQLVLSLQRPPSWWRTNKDLLALAAILPALLFLWLLILRLRPLWLLKINDSLAKVSDVRLPSWLGGVVLPTRYVLLVGFFHYHPRVLDAWVAARVVNIRKAFEGKSTVGEHSVHVPIPILLNDVVLPDPATADLRKGFDGEAGCLLIKGDGGTGKTSFACRIARWALSPRAETRLCPHLMLPVLVEPEATTQFDSEDAVLKFVQTQLKLLASDAEPPNLDLVKNLLRRKRVLLIADSLSEMKETARVAISESMASLPVNASIITSRNDELLNGAPRNVVVMSRIEGNFLSRFLGSYLDHLHKRHLFDDEEFFEACRRLTIIAGGRDITVLLAKLYADHMVMSKECRFDEDAPQNVPELFLQYVNRVNRMAAIDSFDDVVVQRGVKLVAWECLKEQFIPTTVDRDGMISNLGGIPAGLPLIRHLEDKLKIVRTVGVGRDRLRFTLDPLAEYLACLYIVGEYKSDETRWSQLLDRIRGNRVSDIRFFLLALQDCCTVNGNGPVPVAVAKELSRISGWDHGVERQKQRTVLVNRLTKDLRMLDREELSEIQKSLGASLDTLRHANTTSPQPAST